MVDAQRYARVRWISAAAAVASASDAQLASGTLACMAPEAIGGAAPAPSMDIYSAALVLVELLTGRPLIHQSDAWRALYRTANETLRVA